MKKVLLSLSMLAAVMSASAQTGLLIPVYGGGLNNTKDSVNSDAGFATFLPPTGGSVPASFTNNEVTVSGNTYLQLTGTGEYYIWGTTNGNFKAVGTGLNSFGYTGTNAGFVALKAKAASDKPLSKLQISFVPASDETKTFSTDIHEIDAYQIEPEFELEPGTWKSFNIPLTSFYLINADGDFLDASGAVTTVPANYVSPTDAQVRSFGQINVVLNTQSCNYNPDHVNGDGTTGACEPIDTDSDVSVDDIYITQTKLTTIPPIATSTKSAAANIASTKVYPNPATGKFTAEVALINNSNVTVILTDMMGKQIATEVAANGSASFETAGLAKGMYTVTYVLDGTPAKTELVVVK